LIPHLTPCLPALPTGPQGLNVGRPESTISTHLLTLKQLELIGSLGGKPEDATEVLKSIASGDLTITTQSIAFDDIPAGLEALERGEGAGRRFVADIHH
jgi:alcohol dehydrogenase, propanol-preferring